MTAIRHAVPIVFTDDPAAHRLDMSIEVADVTPRTPRRRRAAWRSSAR